MGAGTLHNPKATSGAQAAAAEIRRDRDDLKALRKAIAAGSTQLGQGSNSVTNFAVTTSLVQQAQATVTVPTGYTRALCTGLGVVRLINGSGSSSNAQLSVDINGAAAPVLPIDTIPNTAELSLSCPHTTTLTGLVAGAVLTCTVKVSATVAIPANASNAAAAELACVFLR